MLWKPSDLSLKFLKESGVETTYVLAKDRAGSLPGMGHKFHDYAHVLCAPLWPNKRCSSRELSDCMSTLSASQRAMIGFTFLEWMLSDIGSLDEVFRRVQESASDSAMDTDSSNDLGSSSARMLRHCVDRCLQLAPSAFDTLHLFVKTEISAPAYSVSALAFVV